MNNRLTKFFIGLATVIFLINLMIFNNFSEDESFIEVTATFNKIDGVQKGTPVMISGVQIGSVKKISLNNNFPKVFMSLKKDLDIPDDSSISIQTDGLFGNKFLMIEIGGSENLLLTGNSFLFTEDSILVEELLEKIILIGQNKKDQ